MRNTDFVLNIGPAFSRCGKKGCALTTETVLRTNAKIEAAMKGGGMKGGKGGKGGKRGTY